jgi:hypothetical protein
MTTWNRDAMATLLKVSVQVQEPGITVDVKPP